MLQIKGEASDDASQEKGKGSKDGAVAYVWREILRGLYENRYIPGQRLTEVELTNAFGVSRSSVREALSRLAAEGVVTVQRHRGAIIRRPESHELFDALHLLQLMAGYAARCAADRILIGAHVDDARRAWERVRTPPQGLDSFGLAREQNRFYRTLLDLAGNSELKRIMPEIHIHSLRLRLNDRYSFAWVFADYSRILEAILAGSTFDAERLIREHIGRHIDMLKASTLD